ncbi:MAG: MFS transporter [Ilumatobacter sp.]
MARSALTFDNGDGTSGTATEAPTVSLPTHVTDTEVSGFEAYRHRLAERLEARGTYRRWVLVTALTGMFATSFPVTILTVSLGDIADDFGTSDTVLTWVISGPFLASAVALPVLGKLGDLRGQRKVFLIGFAAATLVAGLTAFAWSALSLIGLRVLSQVIGSATQPTSMALIMRAFPAEERVKALGWWTLVAAGAPAIGLAAGGPLVELVGWRVVFAVQAGLSVIPVIVATLILKETTTSHVGSRFDIAGAVTLALSAGGLLFGLSQSADWGWTHPVVILALVAAPVFAATFVAIERRAEAPLIPLPMLRERNVAAALLVQGMSGAAYMGSFVVTPFLMRGLFGWSLSSVAALLLIRPLSYSLSSPIGGRVAMRIGERTTAIGGTVGLAASMGVFALGAVLENVVLIGIALLCQGIGNGMARPPLGALLSNSVDDDDLGIASAAQRMSRLVGNSVGIAVLTAVYGGRETATTFGLAYLAALALAALGVAASFALRTDQSATAPAEHASPSATTS